jgi:hypothetical protein
MWGDTTTYIVQNQLASQDPSSAPLPHRLCPSAGKVRTARRTAPL